MRSSPRMTEYEALMKRGNPFVERKYIAAVMIAAAVLLSWGIYKGVPIVLETIDVPVVYKSYSTDEITRIEIGRQVFTPDTDPQWKTRVKKVLAGRYEPAHVK